MHYVIIALLFALAGYLLNAWTSGHALAVLMHNGKWELASVGWLGLWPPLSVGLFAGLTLGLLGGSKVGNLLKAVIATRDKAALQKLAEERQQVEAIKANLDAEIKKAAQEGRRQGAEMADHAVLARYEAEDKFRRLARRQKSLEGRLVGAQQKAARLKKKAQLMRGDAPKLV